MQRCKAAERRLKIIKLLESKVFALSRSCKRAACAPVIGEVYYAKIYDSVLLFGFVLISANLAIAQKDKSKPAENSERTKYNIVYILLDDQRYDAMGFLKGQKFLETPNMDSIAKNGVHFLMLL